jgi:hypothetical protein
MRNDAVWFLSRWSRKVGPRGRPRALFAWAALGALIGLGAGAPSCNRPPAAAPEGMGPAAETSSAAPVASSSALKERWVVENFEQPGGLSGGFWFEYDRSSLGTIAKPDPFVPEPGGAPASPGAAAHIWGALGADHSPWTWVQLQVFLDKSKGPLDLAAYKTLAFYVKGNGGRYWVSLTKAAVKNYDHFHYEFTAPAEWTELRVPIAEFLQAGWGPKVPAVFDDVTAIQFSAAEHDKPFDLWVDDVMLSAAEVKAEPNPYPTAGWFPWAGIDPQKRRGTALDVRRVLDAPAGKHGVLGRKGDRFVFADGKAARFWGVNIVASSNFPSHAEAERTAELLAELGVNMTRHHHIDAPWSTPNIFGNQASTLVLDPEVIERFDYFVAQLQKRGIYQFFDMLVHRKATEPDGVADAPKLASGFKIEGEFAPELVDLEERFIDAFMGHKNPYTGRTYAQDPGVALLETINEDSLFYIKNEGDFAVKSPHYRGELNRLFSAWLKKNVAGGRAALVDRWSANGASGEGLGPDEDPEVGNVDAATAMVGEPQQKFTARRAEDTLRFLYETQLGFYRRIEARLRKLGYRALVTGSNHWVEHPLDLLANAELDFIDRHAYWSHPNGGWGYTTDVTWNPTAMVKDPNLGVVGSLAHRRVKGLPYITSEWQLAAPNDYRHEGVLVLGACASFQDFSALEFAFSHDVNKKADAPTALANNFDLIDQPTMLGAWPAVSLLFHRGDVRPASIEAFLRIDPKTANAPGAVIAPPPGLAVVARTGVDFRAGVSAADLEQARARYTKGSVTTSTTGELRHDASVGRFEVDTARSQAFAGFRKASPIALGNATIELESPFAVIIVTALDDQPIAASKRLLVSALGNAVNSGMSLSPSGNRLINVGTAPVLIEPIRGRITLQKLTGSLDKARAYALGASGERATDVTITREGATLRLELDPANKTMHYEIER